MTTSKPPKTPPWPPSLPPSPLSSAQLPLLGAPTDATPSLIHCARTVQGILAHRDLQCLRRFILDAADPHEQSSRQNDLFLQSATRLSLEPGSMRVVQTGLYAWPVAICMPQQLKVRSCFQSDSRDSAGLTAALSRVWAKSLGATATDVQIHGFVDVRLVAGANPLAVQAFVGKQIQHTSRCAAQPIRVDAKLGSEAAHDAWQDLLPRGVDALTSVGINQPVAFLLLAFVSWPTHASPPLCSEVNQKSALRLQALLQALFTHADLDTEISGRSAADALMSPSIRLGKPQPLHDAMTQAQWMQLAWMAERARKTDCSFELEHQQSADILTWAARLTDEFDQVCASLEYAYDGFWRPASHIQDIASQVGLAQATGKMSADSPINLLSH
jgi:hypothetical protein